VAEHTITWNFETDASSAIVSGGGFTASPLTPSNMAEFRRTVPGEYGYTGSVLQLRAAAQTTAQAFAESRWVETVITPPDAGAWTPASLAHRLAKGGASSTRAFNVRTDDDSFTADLGPGPLNGLDIRPTLGNYSSDLSSIGQITGPLAIRFVVYTPDAVDSTKSVEVDDMILTVQTPDGAQNSWTTRAATRVATAAGATLVPASGPAVTITESPAGTFFVAHPAPPHDAATLTLTSPDASDVDTITIPASTSNEGGTPDQPRYFIQVDDGSGL
jgi:hypothetical protein